MIHEYMAAMSIEELNEGDKIFSTRMLEIEVPTLASMKNPKLRVEVIFVARIEPNACFKVYWMTWNEVSVSSTLNNYTGPNYAVLCAADEGVKVRDLDQAEAIFPLLKAAGYRAAV